MKTPTPTRTLFLDSDMMDKWFEKNWLSFFLDLRALLIRNPVRGVGSRCRFDCGKRAKEDILCDDSRALHPW